MSQAPRHTDFVSRFAVDPDAASSMGTDLLRHHFHIGGLFTPDRVSLTYTHYDRLVVGGAMPAESPLVLEAVKPTGTASFLDRREMIAVNVGAAGSVTAAGKVHPLARLDMVYLGRGSDPVAFASDNPADPAKFYFISAPAHETLPARLIKIEEARRIDLGSRETSNERSIFQFIHPEGTKTCQLVMGMTRLATGSVWNTMPCHVHDRRSEVYFYFDLPDEARLFHFMGEPGETRHIVLRNEEAVVSPGWSIHSGAGTSNYAFVWAMAGDNVDYTDVDPVAIGDLR